MPGLSRVSPVSVPPDGANAAAWHSLLAAVERGARMRLIEETAALCSGNPAFARSRKPDTTHLSQGSGFYPNQSLVSYQQLQEAQVRFFPFHEIAFSLEDTTLFTVLYCFLWAIVSAVEAAATSG